MGNQESSSRNGGRGHPKLSLRNTVSDTIHNRISPRLQALQRPKLADRRASLSAALFSSRIWGGRPRERQFSVYDDKPLRLFSSSKQQIEDCLRTLLHLDTLINLIIEFAAIDCPGIDCKEHDVFDILSRAVPIPDWFKDLSPRIRRVNIGVFGSNPDAKATLIEAYVKQFGGQSQTTTKVFKDEPNTIAEIDPGSRPRTVTFADEEKTNDEGEFIDIIDADDDFETTTRDRGITLSSQVLVEYTDLVPLFSLRREETERTHKRGETASSFALDWSHDLRTGRGISTVATMDPADPTTFDFDSDEDDRSEYDELHFLACTSDCANEEDDDEGGDTSPMGNSHWKQIHPIDSVSFCVSILNDVGMEEFNTISGRLVGESDVIALTFDLDDADSLLYVKSLRFDFSMYTDDDDSFCAGRGRSFLSSPSSANSSARRGSTTKRKQPIVLVGVAARKDARHQKRIESLADLNEAQSKLHKQAMSLAKRYKVPYHVVYPDSGGNVKGAFDECVKEFLLPKRMEFFPMV